LTNGRAVLRPETGALKSSDDVRYRLRSKRRQQRQSDPANAPKRLTHRETYLSRKIGHAKPGRLAGRV